MTLEEIKKWQIKKLEQDDRHHSYLLRIDWLIAEVEKAKQVHDVLITATATECAKLAGKTSKVAEHRIKLRFGLCG